MKSKLHLSVVLLLLVVLGCVGSPSSDSSRQGAPFEARFSPSSSLIEHVRAGRFVIGSGELEAESTRLSSWSWQSSDRDRDSWTAKIIRGSATVEKGHQSGRRSLCLRAVEDDGADADLRAYVRVLANAEYRLEAQLLTRDLVPLGAKVHGSLYLGEFDYTREDRQDHNDAVNWHRPGPQLQGTSAGWQTVSYTFRTGPTTQMLRLAASLGNWGRARGEVCLAALQLEYLGEELVGEQRLTPVVERVEVGSELREALVVPATSEVRIEVELPEGAELWFGLGAGGGAGSTAILDPTRRVASTLTVETDRDSIELMHQELQLPASEWFDVKVPLASFAGQRVVIALRSSTPHGTAASAVGYWSDLRLTSGSGQVGEQLEAKASPDVFLLTIDTLRSDHLGIYGYGRETSPAIDRLACESVVYDNAFTTVPRTGPAFASLLTGLYPAGHGVHSMLDSLPEQVSTITEQLLTAGYRTSADTLLNVPWSKGFDQGFERFEDRHDDPVGRGVRVLESSLDWLRRQHPGDPVFQWVHWWDPHFVYDAPEPWTTRFASSSLRGFDLYQRRSRGELTWGQIFFENDLAPEQVEHVVDRYDGEIRYADRMIEHFLQELRESGRYERALIIVTSDHGESLGEHDFYFEHGEYLYDTTLRIPLIVKFPFGQGAGVRVSEPVSILDILPTVAEVVGLDTGSVDGRSLPREQGSETRKQRPLFAQTGRSFVAENPRREVEGLSGYWTSIRRGHLKLIHIPTLDGAEVELFDVVADPTETVDLSDRREAEVAELVLELENWRRRLLEADSEFSSAVQELEPEEAERLRALGYLN